MFNFMIVELKSVVWAPFFSKIPLLSSSMSVSPDVVKHGNQSNLPKHLSTKAFASEVIYWSSPIENQAICTGLFCDSAGILFVLPCFWPHLLVLGGPLCLCAAYQKSLALKTDVLLTPDSLVIVNDTSTQSISLLSILNVTTTTKTLAPCAPYCFIPDVNRIVVDDGRRGPKGGANPTIIMGHGNIDEFSRLIIETKRKKKFTTVYGFQPNMSLQQVQMGVDSSQPGLQHQSPYPMYQGNNTIQPPAYIHQANPPHNQPYDPDGYR
jgi:hypothetical protein